MVAEAGSPRTIFSMSCLAAGHGQLGDLSLPFARCVRRGVVGVRGTATRTNIPRGRDRRTEHPAWAGQADLTRTLRMPLTRRDVLCALCVVRCWALRRQGGGMDWVFLPMTVEV